MLWDADKKFNVSDKIILSGFDAKRSDSARLSKEVQLEVINKILAGKTYEEVITYLQDINKRMKNREYDDEYIGIPKGITKDLYEYNPPSAVIKGAMFSNIHFNTNFGKGTKPKYVYITSYKGERPTIQTPKNLYFGEHSIRKRDTGRV
jgi:DNA polymerase, archaea type